MSLACTYPTPPETNIRVLKNLRKKLPAITTCNYECIFSPEIVQDHPYGEKADIWAIGCILYQMCTLSPPFITNNMLALASRIVAGKYEPLQQDSYSTKVSQTIAK